MYIRKVVKKNKNSFKEYEYFRLIHSYRLGDKTRQIVLLNLGTLEGFSLSKHKLLADRIEQLLTGAQTLFGTLDEQIEKLARKFSTQIIKDGSFTFKAQKAKTAQDTKTGKASKDAQTAQDEEDKKYTAVDLQSAEELESKDLGGEWLVKQAFDRLTIDPILTSLGMAPKDIVMARALLTAKMVHPSSELETQRWLQENSATMELYGSDAKRVTRYHLYKVAEVLYAHKSNIEHKLYQVCNNLFSQQSKVVIFDLTNMHFEGMMAGSSRANFGRSKQKRNDCRLISVSLTIDSLGFVRGSQFWDGNVSEPDTLKSMLDYIDSQFDGKAEKPLLVFDAGISTEENLDMVRDKYDYVCVSRSIPTAFTKLSAQATVLVDNVGNKIGVTKVETPKGETMMLVASDQKKKKEESMDEKITKRFEEKLTYLKEGLDKPRRIKKIEKVYEQIGRLKEQFAKVAQYYELTYTQDDRKGVITDIVWKRKEDTEKPKGQYFLRYSKKDLTDTQIWDAYNLTTEVEASFRCLKSDLNIRPVFHQLDKYIESHIWLGIMAYQVVNYIRVTLKSQDIHYSWSTIVEKLKTQRITTISMDVKGNKKAFIKTCTQPNTDVKNIYDALGFKDRPYVRKTKVVTQI